MAMKPGADNGPADVRRNGRKDGRIKHEMVLICEKATHRAAFLAGEPLFALVSVVPEDHGDAPQARHAYQRVDDAADGAHLAAE